MITNISKLFTRKNRVNVLKYVVGVLGFYLKTQGE